MTSYERPFPPVSPGADESQATVSAPPTPRAPRDGALGPVAMMSLVRRLHRAESEWARRALGATESEMAALHVLVTAKRGGQVLRQRDVAAHVGATAASASILVDRLTLRGLVERYPHPADRRILAIQTTPKADAEFGELLDELHSDMTAVIGHLQPQQRDAATVLLVELAQVVENRVAS